MTGRRTCATASLALVASLAVLTLTACAAEPPPTGPDQANPLLQPAPMRDYVPGGGGFSSPRPRPAGEKPPAESPQRKKPPGSSTAPGLIPPPVTAPLPTPPPVPKDSRDDTNRFKRDLLQPDVDRLRQQNDLGRLDPFQKRDLLNRELELHQLK